MFYTFAFLSNRTTMVKFPGKVVNFCYYLQPRACMKSHDLCLLQLKQIKTERMFVQVSRISPRSNSLIFALVFGSVK